MRTRLSLLSLFPDRIPTMNFSPIEPAMIEKIAASRSYKKIFFKFKAVATRLKKCLANHMKIQFFSKATSCVKIMRFSIGKIDMSMSFKLHAVVFVSFYNNKAVYEHEKTANLQ